MPVAGVFCLSRVKLLFLLYRETSQLHTEFPQDGPPMNLILDNQFSDLDLLTTCTRDWDLEFRLMHKGGFSGQIRQVALPHLLITYARFGSRLHQSGSTPPGFRTFGLPSANFHGLWWLGYEADGRSLFKFGADRELAAVSDSDFAVYNISLRLDYLERLAEALGAPCVATDREIVRIPAARMKDLRVLARAATFHSSERPRDVAAHQLAEGLVTSCAAGKTLPRPSPRSRDGAVKRVLEYLDEYPDVLPDLPTLCGIAHVSERTLQYAFHERYGISPNAFVRGWQLNSARRMLRSSNRDKWSIADIAAQCGFYDPSLFASHYRLLFGELPSATSAKVAR